MRPKARGQAQHGGPPGCGWRRVSRQVWFCTWWTGRTACLFRTVPVALTGAAQLRADGISSRCYIVNVHNHPSWATSRKEGMAWYSSRPICLFWLHGYAVHAAPLAHLVCWKTIRQRNISVNRANAQFHLAVAQYLFWKYYSMSLTTESFF
jgi:hypothetical protein